VPDVLAQFIAKRRPDLDPTDIVPVGLPAVRVTIEKMVAAGASKFVLLPLNEPTDDGWTAELERIAAEVKPLEN
jgi:hypothetical protein